MAVLGGIDPNPTNFTNDINGNPYGGRTSGIGGRETSDPFRISGQGMTPAQTSTPSIYNPPTALTQSYNPNQPQTAFNSPAPGVVPGMGPGGVVDRSGQTGQTFNPTTNSWTNTSAAPSTSNSVWGNGNPWQGITGSINGQQTNLAPGLTQQAGTQLANMYGANLVGQNTTNMASPGSTAPSAPRYGLDFGYGDVQDAEQVARWRDRGDSEDLIRQRLQAGLNNTGWGGPAPQVNTGDMLYNRSTPLTTNLAQGQVSSQFRPQASFGASTFRQQPSTGMSQPSSGSVGQGGNIGQGNSNPFQGMDMPTLLNFLSSLLFGGGQGPRQPELGGPQIRRNLLSNYYYPQSEPNFKSSNSIA